MASSSASGPLNPTGGASTSDLLTALKNVVTALNNATQTYLNVNGATNLAGIGAPTVVKNGAGRLVLISVTVAGSTQGAAYDGATLTATGNPLCLIPEAVGIYEVDLPARFGIVIYPGTGQALTVSYS
jgi:hypothetical protein